MRYKACCPNLCVFMRETVCVFVRERLCVCVFVYMIEKECVCKCEVDLSTNLQLGVFVQQAVVLHSQVPGLFLHGFHVIVRLLQGYTHARVLVI